MFLVLSGIEFFMKSEAAGSTCAAGGWTGWLVSVKEEVGAADSAVFSIRSIEGWFCSGFDFDFFGDSCTEL